MVRGMLLAFPGLSFGGASALLLYCSLSLLTPKTFTPLRFTLPYADALYLASRQRAFTLTSGHVPTLFLFSSMAGYLITPVLVFWTLRDLHWVKFTFETGFELPSSCRTLPCYAAHLNRNILDFMSWHQIDLGAQDLNGIQRPKYFSKSSWK